MIFASKEVNRCNLGHLNAPEATVCGWCGAPLATSAATSNSSMEFGAGWWPLALVLLAVFSLLAGLVMPLLSFDALDTNFGTVGFFSSSVTSPSKLRPFWPGGLPPGVFLLLLLVPILVIAGLLYTRREFPRNGVIALAASLWGLGAALFVIDIADFKVVSSRISERIDEDLVAFFAGLTSNPGGGFVFVLGAALLLAAAGFVVVFGSRSKSRSDLYCHETALLWVKAVLFPE